MANELELSNDLKVNFFHHVLQDYAIEFYRDNIEENTVNFGEIVFKMNEQFCSNVRMEAIARKLEIFYISQFEKEGKEEHAALKELTKEIQNLVPQAPIECRSDQYQKRLLCDATRGKQWALQVPSASNFMKLTYQQLLYELESALQQYKFHKNFSKAVDDDVFRKSCTVETNLSGQGRYFSPNPKGTRPKRYDSSKKC